MVALSTNSSLRFADVTHAALLDDERGADISTRVISDVVQAARTDSPLPPHLPRSFTG
jgi:hypothetical protein